ncbi:SDR family NAD(P)-dependent oxidoreductase [Streptomyces sp. NPDC018610]|uniref:type I polyketide synthase n=1 Tax=Streptomyces sp. NPDC018610 TaxID=3365049 RepID=UPI003790938B
MSIAVIGMAGRFPQAPDLNAFWELLAHGRDAIGPVPADRWDPDEVTDPVKDIQAVGGFLEGVDLFDAGFFGISPREAEVLDPQQRLLLEAVWRALEDADTPAAALRGTRTGVYVGGLWHDHELLRKDRGAPPTQHSIVGNSLDILSSRISYTLGLTGPSLTVESSCSSSLVALHQACQAIRSGEVDTALVGGCNLMLTPEVTVGLAHFGGLSPTGRCHAFGAGADGFVRGEGVAVVYLKAAERAVRDGDRIRAVVCASAVNNDGGGESLVTPHPAAQVDLLRRVYGPGGIDPASVAYVEAHGTGTVRGDFAEASALGEVLGTARGGEPLRIGSVKTNIGHLEPAAGLAGLFKAVLALEHGSVPPSLHAEELSPRIDFDALNLEVVRQPLPLPPGARIGVNSFGWGGTNAHAVVEPPPPPASVQEGAAADGPFVLPLSGHTPRALEERTASVRALLAAGADPRAVARSLAHHRDHFPERRALVGPSLREAAVGRARETGKVAFVFPGQGAQWAGMGAGLYGADPAFTAALDRCAEALRAHVSWDVRDLVTGRAPLAGVERVQPALWAMSVSLAAAWERAGVRPDVVVGHSQGEIAAATVAGALTVADGALAVARRSALLRKVAGHGRMLAVDLDTDGVRKALEGFEGLVELAVENGPRSCVLAGEADPVLLLKEILETDDVFCRLVDVDYGSHSPQMDPILGEIRSVLAPLTPRTGHIPLLSTVDLRVKEGGELDAAHWAANLRGRVRFAEAVRLLLDDRVTHLVEISPHPGLGTALRQLGEERPEPPAVLGTLRRDEGSAADLVAAFGTAYVSGLPAYGPPDRQRPGAAVPPYPLQRERYAVAAGRTTSRGRLELTLRPATANGLWEDFTEPSLADHPWLGDHRLHDVAVFPGGGQLALLQHALRDRADGPLVFRDVRLTEALPLSGDPVRLGVTWRPGAGPNGMAQVASAQDTGWTVHCRALASWGAPIEPPVFPARLAADGAPLTAEDFYRRCAARGLPYGPAFRTVTGGSRAGDEALVVVALPGGSRSGRLADAVHPVLWDGVLQAALAVTDGPCLPVAVRAATLPAETPERLLVHARRTGHGVDLAVFAEDRTPLGRLDGVALAGLPETAEETDGTDRLVFRTVWEPGERADGEPGAVHWTGDTARLPGPEPDGVELARADVVAFVAPADSREGLARLAELVRRTLAENPSARLAVLAEEAGPYEGFVAVAQSEHPQLVARLITGAFTELTAGELGATEDRVELRDGRRLVGRRVRGGGPALPPAIRSGGERPYRLAVGRPGSLETLAARPLETAPPAAGRVTVRTTAAALNFIDVMKALGVYPDTTADRTVLGLECAGTVTAVGEGVTGVAPGDRVVACGFGALGSEMTADARHVVPVPRGLSGAQAAALPMVLVTAWYALIDVARTGPGETVLVHSATGGLGLAALQVARMAGAEVIATAGTEEKRAHLRSLGVRHVFDSRGLRWAEQVREATGGRGVDVVLNSLSGAALTLGLEALAEDGRFVEVGKRDIHGETSIGLGAFRKAVTVSAVDIAGLLRRRPERFATVLETVWGLLEAGEFTPLPVREFPFADAERAFRTMSRGEHIGKLVLTPSPVDVVPEPLPGGRFRPGGTYLITGGLGALGLSLAEHLADRGAGAVALLGRGEPKDPERVEALRRRGARVMVWSADVADPARVREVLEEIRTQLPPLRGVFHAAGVLADATLANVDAALLDRALRPKADGARVLHELTAADGLDLFVLFSSAAAYVGTAGQAAYAAANSALDSLARSRRAAGLPALSVQWGPVSGAGLAAAGADRLAARGLGAVTPEECWRALDRFLADDEDVVGCLALDPGRWLETYPAAAALPSWRLLAADGPDASPTGGPGGLSPARIAALVRDEAAQVLRLAPDRLAPDAPLRSLGMDSLMSLELRNRLEAALGLRLSPTLLWKHGTLARLVPALTELTGADT